MISNPSAARRSPCGHHALWITAALVAAIALPLLISCGRAIQSKTEVSGTFRTQSPVATASGPAYRWCDLQSDGRAVLFLTRPGTREPKAPAAFLFSTTGNKITLTPDRRLFSAPDPRSPLSFTCLNRNTLRMDATGQVLVRVD